MKKRITILVDEEIIKKLDNIARIKGDASMGTVVREAIQLYVKEYEKSVMS